MRASTSLRISFSALLLAASAVVFGQNAETSRPVSVRAGPDRDYPEVARLDSGTPVQVMGCLNDWTWCDVAVEDMRGWLWAPALSYSYEGGYVPLYNYAPALGIGVVSFTVDDYWDRYYRGRPWYSQRGDWEHRPLRHERPPGPGPSSNPPPRPVRGERPAGGSERTLRLGNADSAGRDNERRDSQREDTQRREGSADHEARPSHEDRSAPQPRPADTHARPAERPAPAAREENARPAAKPDAAHHDENSRRDERTAPQRADNSKHEEDQGDRPR